MPFKGSPVLFYDVGVWGKLGFGVPNWGKRMTSANMVILELVEVLGRNLQAMMLHPDALSRTPPSINTIIDIHKLVLRARSLLATEQVVDNQLRMEPTHAQPDKQSFIVFPTPIFMVRNRWLKTYCYYVLNALSEAMQSTENDNGFEITQVFAGIVGQPIVRLYKRMAVELLQVSPSDASVPKDANGNPNWYAFTLTQAQIMAYAPSTWFTPTELIDTVSPIDDIPSAYDLEALSNEDAAAAKAFNESLTDLWESLKFLGETLGAKIAPLLKEWVDTATGIVSQSKEWIASNGAVASSGEMLWATLKLQWTKGTNYLKDAWDGMTGWIESTWIDTGAMLSSAWATVSHSFKKTFGDFTSFFQTEWSWSIAEMLRGIRQSVDYFKRAWDDTLGWFGKRSVEVAEIAGHIKKPAASAARRAIDAGKAVLGLDEPELKAQLAAIETRRAAAQSALDARLKGARAGRDQDVAGLQEDLDRLTAAADQKRQQIGAGAGGPGAGGRAKGSAQAGIATALMQLKGISGEDVRTSSGFRGLMQSLHQTQTQNPLVALGQQQFNLQQQEARDLRQLRLNSDKLKVRN